MTLLKYIFLTSLLLIIPFLPSSVLATTQITELGNVVVHDINNSGQIVGRNPQRAFLWENGVMTDLGTLGGNNSVAIGINDSGKIVGASTINSTTTHAFLWENGVMTDLGTLGGNFSEAYSINNTNQIVGMSSNSAGQFRGFIWENGVMTDLGSLNPTSENMNTTGNDINNLGQVVGQSLFTESQPIGFLWENGTMTSLSFLGGLQSNALAINNIGLIVGSSKINTAGDSRAVLWENGLIKNLGLLPGTVESQANSINDINQIVGSASASNGSLSGFIWENDSLWNIDQLNRAARINNNGQIIGEYAGQARLIALQASVYMTVNDSSGPLPEPVYVPYNANVTINWSSEFTNACELSPSGLIGSNGTLSLSNVTSSDTYTITCTGLGGVTVTDSITMNVLPPPQLTTLSPAKVWVGLKNSDSIGVKFDLRAEVYKDNTLVSSGQLNSFPGGSSGFNNANLATIPFDSFTPVDFLPGSELKVILHIRNACVGSGHNSGTARLWYNDSQANSHFDATIGNLNLDYFLLDNFILHTSPGSGPKKTKDVASGARCSPFKPFGTWAITP